MSTPTLPVLTNLLYKWHANSYGIITQGPTAVPTRIGPRDRCRGKPSQATAPTTFVFMLCWMYALASVGILAVMRLAGDRWWAATLLLFSPRWIWAVPLPFLALAPLLWRRWKLFLPLVISGVTMLFGVMEFRIPWRQMIPHESIKQTLRLVTCNLHNTESDLNILNAFVTETNPDIILLQDYTWQREPQIVQHGGWYRHPYEGMYVASRYPFGKFEDLLPLDSSAVAYERFGLLRGHAHCYVVDAPGGPFHLVNLHLASAHRSLAVLRQRKRLVRN